MKKIMSCEFVFRVRSTTKRDRGILAYPSGAPCCVTILANKCQITKKKLQGANGLAYFAMLGSGNTKKGSITVPLTSCLTGLESAV
jgi:hypothetical protein